MTNLRQAASEFLAQKRIAVAGVSRQGDLPANFVYRKLRDTGHEVFPVNPKAEVVEGDPCYHGLADIPGGVDAVVIATPPEMTSRLVRECGDLGIRRVWMHRSFGHGSVDHDAVRLGEELGLEVIPGSCPMMFLEPVDVPHKCMRWIQKVTGGQAQPVGYA